MITSVEGGKAVSYILGFPFLCLMANHLSGQFLIREAEELDMRSSLQGPDCEE